MNQTLRLFVDTDAFVGFARRDDSHHEQVKNLLQHLLGQPVTFITSNYVFAESVTVISQRVSHAMAVSFIETLHDPASPYGIKRADQAIEEEAIAIFTEQQSKNTSFVDCTNMAFMRQLQLDAIFSFDEVYKKNGFLLVEDYLATAPPQEEPEDGQKAA